MTKDNAIQVVRASSKGVNLSEAALAHIQSQLDKREKGVGIRFSVGKTGCSGLSYQVDFVDEINPEDKAFEVSGLKVFIDKKSYPYLKGLHIDFKQQGLNHKFVFKNPNQTGECGCGESFTVDEQFSDQ